MLNRARDGDSRRRGREERGDTLVEVLITVMVVSITSVALLMGFSTSISGSAAHRTLVSNDVVLRTVSQGVYAQVEQQVSPLYQPCAQVYLPSGSTQFNAPSGYSVSVDVALYWVVSSSLPSGGWVTFANLPSTWCTSSPVPATPQQLLITVSTPNHRTLTTTIVVNQPLALITTFDITSISPPSAPPGATGLSILIYGNGFVNGVTGSFSNSGITINSWTWGSSTSITVKITVSPTASSGPGTLTLTNPDGSTASGAFDVSTAPTIASVSQSTFLPGDSNVPFDITGLNFDYPGSTVSFLPSGTTALSFVGTPQVTSTTSITSTINVDANSMPGTYYVMVTNSDGQTSNHYPLTIAMPPPSVTLVTDSTGVSPCAIASTGSTTCDVTGGGFYSPVSVSITPSAGNGNACTPVATPSVTSPTKMTLTLSQPGNCFTSGYYDLTVIAAGGTSQPYPQAFSN